MFCFTRHRVLALLCLPFMAQAATVPDTPAAELPPAPTQGWQQLPPGSIVELHPAPPSSQVEGAEQALFVRYTLTNVYGELALASGLVLLPKNQPHPEGQWPLVVYGHMTTGGADACAPTRGTAESSELRRMQQGDEVARQLLQRGVVVARPDYEGLGEAGPHPYLRGDSLAQAMRDMASAVAAHWTGIGKTWVAAGHSEGGVAALNTGSRLHPPARDLELAAVVSITPVTQMEHLLTLAEPLPVTGPGVQEAVALAALALKGIGTQDPDFERLLLQEGGLSEQAVALWPDLERLCLQDLASSGSWGGLSPQAVQGPRGEEAVAEFIRALQEDDVRLLPMRRDLPIRIDAGALDVVALLPFTEELVADYRRRGYAVTYVRWPAEHSPTADMAAVDIADWIMAQAFAAGGSPRAEQERSAELRGGLTNLPLILLLGLLCRPRSRQHATICSQGI